MHRLSHSAKPLHSRVSDDIFSLISRILPQRGIKMIGNSKITKMLYGGDYNPEQWPEETREQDMKLLKEAGVDIVTLNVFNWAMIQPSEERYDFSELDETVKRVTENGMSICMATSTGAHPAWMARRYPEILRTEFSGMRRKFGGRHNSCPNSYAFRHFSAEIASHLAEHFKDQKNIVAWHVSNEYGGACYCENCENAFRVWLRKKYGSLDAVNQAWNTHFWGHTFYEWEEIVAPNLLSEHFEERRSMFPGITLDYKRFMSDSMLENFRAEYAAIKKWIPDAQITTNLMGLYDGLDYQKWGKYMDFVSWDNYPEATEGPADIAFKHDLMRGVKRDIPFCLMEQTPSVSNWLPSATLKRPGEMRLISYQAAAHGADTVMFFQMRQSMASCEKFHGAIIQHVGNDENRVFRECAQLGTELKKIGDATLGSMAKPKTAILYDWNNRWAIEGSSGLSLDIEYPEEVLQYYRPLFDANIDTDVIGMQEDLSRYQLVIAPELYMVKPGVRESLETFVQNGGTLVLSLYCGITNENDQVVCGGYPGELRRLSGIWTEEFDALKERENSFIWNGTRYPARYAFAISHCEQAESLEEYQSDFYAGTTVLTRNAFGKGKVYYVGTRSNADFYHDFMRMICEEAGIVSCAQELTKKVPEEMEITKRSSGKGDFWFCLNHQEKEVRLIPETAVMDVAAGKTYTAGEKIIFAPYDVKILQKH